MLVTNPSVNAGCACMCFNVYSVFSALSHQLIFLGHVLTDTCPLNVQDSDICSIQGVCAVQSNTLPLGFLERLWSCGCHLYGQSWRFTEREREIQNNGLMIIHFELNFSLYTLIQVSGSQLHCLKPVNICIVLSLLLMTIWSVSFDHFHSTCFLSELISYYSSSVENACSKAFFSHWFKESIFYALFESFVHQKQMYLFLNRVLLQLDI